MENLAKQTDITAMQPAGRVLPLWRGEYRNGEFYEQTDIVLYNNSSYIAKQDTIGNLPPESANANDYWQLVAKGIIDADISDATVEFEEALTRENIESGEAAETLFGKIRKIFADLKPIAFTESYSDLKNTPGVVSKSSDGLVQKGDGQANKVWKTDNNGNPGWRDDVNTQAITSVNGKTGAVTLTAADVNACPATGVIDKLTNIGQITGIGFWAIGSIDNAYATSIGIDNNAGDFYALVLSYNGNGIDFFNFGTIILTTPRINGFHYEIQIWEGRASAVKTLNNRSVLNTIEEISANTESRNVAGALAAKTMMADYNAKINQINSNLDNVNLLDVFYYFLDDAVDYINNFDNITHPIIFTHLENAPEDDNPAGSYWVFVLTLKRQQQSVQICFSIGANIIKFRTKDGENVTKWQQI